jgi:hypothetical protein
MTLSNLTRHLPRQRAIARAFATRTHRSAGEYAGVLSLGLIAGAALALLLAPDARRELRKKVSERVDGLRKRATKKQFINGHADDRADSPT